MNPGEVWKDETGAHWKVMDARIGEGDRMARLVKPVRFEAVKIMRVRTSVKEHEYPQHRLTKTDKGRHFRFARKNETAGWERVVS